MQTYELIKSFLIDEGYRPQDEEYALVFSSEGLNYVVIRDDDDDQYLNINLACVLEVDENNVFEALTACNIVNKGQKVVKANIRNDSVWLSFEQLFDSDPCLEDIIPRAIQMLRCAFFEFGKAMGLVEEGDDTEEESEE